MTHREECQCVLCSAARATRLALFAYTCRPELIVDTIDSCGFRSLLTWNRLQDIASPDLRRCGEIEFRATDPVSELAVLWMLAPFHRLEGRELTYRSPRHKRSP